MENEGWAGLYPGGIRRSVGTLGLFKLIISTIFNLSILSPTRSPAAAGPIWERLHARAASEAIIRYYLREN